MINEAIRKVKDASYFLGDISFHRINEILRQLAKKILEEQNFILKENAKDLTSFDENNPNYDRLLLTKDRLKSMSDDLIKVADLPSPLSKILSEKKLPNGLILKKITVPLGVIGIIYESRPNVTIDVFSLCFKSGNACILKGGKEAFHSNNAFIKIIHEILEQNDISKDIVYLMPKEKEAVFDLLHASGLVDVCIPRGGQGLIQFVRDNAKVPIIETGAGIVHTYFDESGDVAKAQKIITNAKTRRVSVCNALDTLIVHEKRLLDLPELVSLLSEKGVEILADEKSYDALVGKYAANLKKAQSKDFGCEFLSYKMSIKTVNNLDEAISHIMHYTSHHSEAIIAENKEVIEAFLNRIDAAVVYVNASTAFTDGAQFGMGAEIGISTQKLHARGPMGLDALTSYKWLVYGDGQIRS